LAIIENQLNIKNNVNIWKIGRSFNLKSGKKKYNSKFFAATILFQIIMASTVGTLFQLVPAIPIELIKTKLQVKLQRMGCWDGDWQWQRNLPAIFNQNFHFCRHRA
jgi:hypothetical protein